MTSGLVASGPPRYAERPFADRDGQGEPWATGRQVRSGRCCHLPTPPSPGREAVGLLPLAPAARAWDGYVCHSTTGAPMPRYLATAARPASAQRLQQCSRFASQDLQHHHWVLDRLDGQATASRRSNSLTSRIGEHFTVNGIAGCKPLLARVTSSDKLWVTTPRTAMARPPN